MALAFGGGPLGAEVMEMSEELRRFFGAPADRGVLVNRVEADSPGAQAGLKAGDVIVEVDGKRVVDADDVREVLLGKKAGEKVTVAVVRAKAKTSLVATVRESKNAAELLMSGLYDRKQWPLPGADDLREQLARTEKQLREVEKRLEKLEKGR
jgi:C-terminal processing protease CtpA/Prc